jgi:eukaryotic-like serine/threonine-protein kinase
VRGFALCSNGVAADKHPAAQLDDDEPVDDLPDDEHDPEFDGATEHGGAFATRAESPRARAGGAEAPTVITRGRRDGSTAGTAGASASQLGSASSPIDALAMEEVERTRVMAVLCLFITAFATITLPFLAGNDVLRWILIGSMVANFTSSAWIIRHVKRPEDFTDRLQLAVAIFATLTGHLVVLYWGALSAAPMLFVLGIYFFSRGQNATSVNIVYGLTAGLQVVWAVLILGGFMDDPGLSPSKGIPLYVHVVTQVVLQFLLFAAHTLARETRKSTLKAIDAVLEARRQAAQREAMFEEVRQDLDRVLQIGGAGRHTDKQIGDWRLGVVIGRGAMGEVYEAVSARGDLAAIKLLHPNVMAHPGSIERFLREARAAGQLESPHVVRIFDASEPTAPLPYLIMERLWGHDLAHHLRRRRRLGRDKLEQMCRQVGSVLDEAGDKGIVHRDIKPQNLFLAEQPGGGPATWKVLDFGASKLAEHSGTLTEGRVVGTPGYMAPEQARGEDVSPSADVYALAAIAYRCLTGRPPFSFREIHTCLYNVCFGMPPQPSRITELPLPVDTVLAIGLAKAARDRFLSAAEFTDALMAALAGHADPWLEQRAAKLLEALPWSSTAA